MIVKPFHPDNSGKSYLLFDEAAVFLLAISGLVTHVLAVLLVFCEAANAMQVTAATPGETVAPHGFPIPFSLTVVSSLAVLDHRPTVAVNRLPHAPGAFERLAMAGLVTWDKNR